MNEQEFYIGQVFNGAYPPEAANWCNQNNAYIADASYEAVDEDGTKTLVRMYEIKAIPEPTEEEIKQQRIAELKAQLDDTDWKIIKCNEYQLAGEELPYDIAELHAQRQALRDEINQLEQGE